MTTRAVTTTLVVALLVLACETPAHAQGWSVAVSAGRLVYDPLVADIGTNNLMGSLRFDGRRETWIYGAAAAPLEENGTVWGGAGAGGRLTAATSHGGRATYGGDIGAHGFVFKDRVVDQGGNGGSIDALPFARVSAGLGFIEGRAGLRAQTLSYGGTRESRSVFETGARAGYGSTVTVEGDVHWVRAAEGTFPFFGTTVGYRASRFDLWGQIGKWASADLNDPSWGFGGVIAVGSRTSVWGAVRQEAPDPLYWNSPRRSWTVAITQRLGRTPAPFVTATPTAAGTVTVRLASADAPAGDIFIAGDFNNWQPVPMQRDGSDWVVRLSLKPGVYHYTFRTAGGEWFVPSSFAGRRDDGFGGYHVVLVVG